MPIAIEVERQKYIEARLIGFGPNTSSVKPVHIANGLFRTAIGTTFDTELLNQFVFWQKNNGDVPPGHELDAIYDTLSSSRRLDSMEVQKDELARLRVLLKGILNADDGVYMHRDRMESYSAGFVGFISEDRIAQDGGELIAEWLRVCQSPLLGYAKQALSKNDDVITNLCLPLLDTAGKNLINSFDPDLQFLYNSSALPAPPKKLWEGLAKSAETLSQHLGKHPNKLFGLRLVTLFASFVLIRHLACLETYYVPGAGDKIVPFLLDFSTDAKEPVARASLMSYILTCRSISRFYTWAFGECLKQYYTPEQLGSASPPTYRNKNLSLEAKEIWELALLDIEQGNDPFSVCGQALYDVMAREAEGNPITYLRQLGHRSGLLWPPTNSQPAKRFVAQQDMLETLIRGVVNPGETVGLSALQDRLWEHYGIVVGGRAEDEERLVNAGVYQADSTALRENRTRFAARLSDLDFAHMLADGVFQVTLEG